jgi:hypothetical protein
MGKSPHTTKNSVLFHDCISPNLLLNGNTNMEQHHGWIRPLRPSIMDVQWKIHVRLHFHSCANMSLITLLWNWTKFMYVFY